MQITIIDRGLPIDRKEAAIGLIKVYKPEVNLIFPDDDFVATQASNLSTHLSNKDFLLNASAAATSGFSFGNASVKYSSFIALLEHARVLSITQTYKNGVLQPDSKSVGDKLTLEKDTLHEQSINAGPEEDIFQITYVYGVGFRVQIEVSQLEANANVTMASMATQASAGKLQTSIQTDIFGFSPNTPDATSRLVPDVLMQNKPFDLTAQGALTQWRSQFQASMAKLAPNQTYNPKLLRVSFTGKITQDFSELIKVIPAVTYVLRRLKHGDTLEKAINYVNSSNKGGQRDFDYFGKDLFSELTLTSIYQVLFNAFDPIVDDILTAKISDKLQAFAKNSIDRFDHMTR